MTAPAGIGDIALAQAARDAGRFEEAIGHAIRAFDAASGATAPAILLATLTRQRGRPEDAGRALRRALALDPAEVDLWNHLGLAERHANRPDAALEAFVRAARLDPRGRWAETNMAFQHLREPGQEAARTFAALGKAGDPPVCGLGLFCDRFPHTYGFLIQQYVSYLSHFPDARAYSLGRRVFEPWDAGQFAAALDGFKALRPELGSRVHQLLPELLDPERPGEGDHVRLRLAEGAFRRPRLAHCVFAMNADLFRPLFETLGIPFTFTLNPGGGFRLDDAYSDARLARVFASPLFRKVIVTYPLTHDYIRRRFQVPEERIALIPGTIVLEDLLAAHRGPRRRFGPDKATLDVAFAGLRYSPTGADKGYDRFVAALRPLTARFPELRVHVVGNFDADTVDLGPERGRFTFHGVRDQRWMAGFFAGMDAIVSPNVADHLAKGAFDGFPVTTCIEAGMCGVALFATDPMRLNFALEDGRHYVAITERPDEIAATLGAWLADPERLARLGAAGAARFGEVWGIKAQMEPRLALMRTLLEAEG